ncbi:hypothetical protein [Bacteriovorax sp. Seq25_V]|uniref:hypothetical protein n=1 Tax=Bacteriovorax sp. Seq25_V TaxID=1201288 RepID=UPI0012F7D9E1|nr:hypothetical protein [Bacteriovorax sp. Seq25_V]
MRLTSFLSDLFDLEIDNSRDSIRLVNEDLSFLIIEREEKLNNQGTLMLDFFVSSLDELHQIKDKYQFLNYRQNSLSTDGTALGLSTQPIEIKEAGDMSFFFFTDPDQRRWKVSYLGPQ